MYGVSDINYMGQRDYSIRAWLDPQKLASRSMTAMDVANAHPQQNIDAPAGQIGQLPASKGQHFQLPIDTLGRLTNPEQFANIVVKVGSDSPGEPATGIVRLRDVARVELGAQNYNQSCTLRRQAVGGPEHLPAPRDQCAGRRRPGPGQDGGAQDAVPRRRGLRHRLRHDAVHPRVGPRGLQDPPSTP